MSSIKEVAKHAGVSPASVSIYLNNRATKRVSTKTKERIDLAVQELNYHKNIFASSLTTRESRLIGVIVPTILPLFQNDYTNALLSGIQARLSASGYGLLFFPSSAQSSIEIVKEQLEKSVGCDGYILFSTGFCTLKQTRKNIAEIKKVQRPFVTINVPKIDDQVNQVLLVDLGLATGARHLIEEGHRKLLLVLGRRGGEHTQHIRNNFQQLMKQHHLDTSAEHILYGDYSAETTFTVVKNALEKYPETTGICCMSDVMASSTIKAIREVGKSVPGEVSVIGRNNSLYSRLSSPSLSTIDLHMHEAGLSSANLLLDALSGNSVTQKILMSGTLVKRDSVKTIKRKN